MVFELVLPIPETTAQIILVLIGFIIGEWFSQLDWNYQQTDGFKNLKSDVDKMIVKTLLDIPHHWPLGALLFFFPSFTFVVPGLNFLFSTAPYAPTLMWIGVGLWTQDWRNWQHVLDRYKHEDDKKPGG